MPSLRPRPKQIMIAFDQLCNTIVGGWADETFSARCWRLRERGRGWRTLQSLIDCVAWVCGDKHHCEESYKSEVEGRQLPPGMRQ